VINAVFDQRPRSDIRKICGMRETKIKNSVLPLRNSFVMAYSNTIHLKSLQHFVLRVWPPQLAIQISRECFL